MNETKKKLRKEVLGRREGLTWRQIEIYSKRIAERLFLLPQYQIAQTVMYFLNFGKEVMTLKMVPQTLAQGRRVVAPKTVPKTREMILSEVINEKEDLAPGLWNIPEPKVDALRPLDPSAIDFVVSPGVAFDADGNRLGYGGGYYDRFFAQLSDDVPIVALTFELQMLDTNTIPVEPWDKKVDIIITEERIIHCGHSNSS